jgi:hypothetical protein
MPLIFRAMIADAQDGKPVVAASADGLGVRLPPTPSSTLEPDIIPDANGMVNPGIGGMSVAPDWRKLPDHRIPERLRPLVPRARGKKKSLRIWKMGEGDFAAGPVAPNLLLRLDPDNPDIHGFVEPEQEMNVKEYQDALAATRDSWEDLKL